MILPNQFRVVNNMSNKISSIKIINIYTHKVYDHNNTLLGIFKSEQEAVNKQAEYIWKTGNSAYHKRFRKLRT